MTFNVVNQSIVKSKVSLKDLVSYETNQILHRLPFFIYSILLAN
jgi:hypothetical protein